MRIPTIIPIFAVFVLLAPAVAAQVPDILPKTAQQQVHISYVDDAYAVTFASSTRIENPAVPWRAVDGETGTAKATLQGRGTEDDSVFTYSAKLPAKALTYTVTTAVGTNNFDVKAPPLKNATIKVAFVADQGVSTESATFVAMMKRMDVDLVIHGGDLSYANGRASRWDEWFPMVEPVASRVPWMPALGNHERICESGSLTVTPKCDADTYAARFVLPNEPNFFYSFNWGPAKFVSVDTEAYHPTDFAQKIPQTSAKAQEAFIADTLAADDDAWRIVFMHRPAYSSNAAHGSDLDVRAALAPILEAGGADVVLAGHDHHYERTWPMLADKIVSETANPVEGQGIIYLVGGGSGRNLYEDFEEQPDWSAFRKATHEFIVLEISHEAIKGTAYLLDGKPLDVFSVTRASTAVPSGDTIPNLVPGAGLATLIAGVAVVAVAFASGRKR